MTYTIDDINPVYTYSISNITVSKSLDNLQNVITTVNFVIEAVCILDNITIKDFRMVTVQLDNPDPNNFLPINEITKDTIISWIENHTETLSMKDTIKEYLLAEYNKNEYTYIL